MKETKIYRGILMVIGLIAAIMAFAVTGQAQSNEAFIYGKVHTGRTTYTGPIRWGNEEVLWSDLFNGIKRNNDYTNLVPKDNDKESWSSYNWNFASIWENKETQHQFKGQFGNIKEIIVNSPNSATLKLKNGGEFRVGGEGYNDIGAKVQIIDAELGVVSIDWDRIQRIEFLPTPAKLEFIFGKPLYGTVEGARKEKYSGFIVWDTDERLSSDKLDGETDDGDVSIKFSEISSIEKSGHGCEVKLNTGRTVFLENSNDVNDENRGVEVVDPDYGIIKFSWKAFKRITFSSPPVAGQTFQQYPGPVPIQATVSMLDGDDVSGRIIYDIDEALDFEMIEGKENDIEYNIPVRNIRKITPKNFDYSQIQLKSGQTLLLGGMRDVSEENSGLLVFVKGKKDPVHIAWRKINEITFH